MTSKPAKDPKTGRFLPRADRAGAVIRPRARKAVRTKLGELFLEDMLSAWESRGAAAIHALIEKNPHDFLKAVAALIYFEGITRTNATGGSVAVTFTPLKGMSSVVSRYLLEPSEDRTVVTMTIDDAEHYTPQERAKIVASYPAHEKEARTKGVPTLGSGRIFPVTEEQIRVEPFEIPRHWVQIGGLDFGWDHPFAAALCAWDREADVFYVTRVYREREATPIIHAAALKPWGPWLPWAWPHDGLQHDKGSGEQLAAQYRGQGLAMLSERATFDDGTNGVEAGISDMLQRMQTDRFKVFSTAGDWFEEFRSEHLVRRHDGGAFYRETAFRLRHGREPFRGGNRLSLCGIPRDYQWGYQAKWPDDRGLWPGV